MKPYHILLLASLISLTSCTVEQAAQALQEISNQSSNATVISLIELNDLHAHLTEHMDYVRVDDSAKIVKRGGLARIASAIKDIRSDNPNSLLMNIGDTFHGGVEALYTNGNAIVDPINALGIDIGVPGNWDFAYGPSVTRLRFTGTGANPSNYAIKQVNYPTLAANVSSTTRLDFLPATKIITIDGIQIGFIGITSDIVPRMFKGFAYSFNFLAGQQNYLDLIQKHAKVLRQQGADSIIVMSELGIHKDLALADLINENSVDVIFSAHTHELTYEPIISDSGALVVESGNDTFLGRMDLSFDENKNILSKSWSIIEIDSSFKRDAQVQALVETSRKLFLADDVDIPFPSDFVSQRLSQPIDTVIASSNITLDRRHVLNNSFNQSFTHMLRQYSGTDIAFTPGFRFGSLIPATDYLLEDNSIASGNITIEDAYRFFPVTLNISTAKITGANLKSLIEFNLNNVFSNDAFNQSGGWFDGFDGIDLALNLQQGDNKRVSSIRFTGSDIQIRDEDTLSVTACSRPLEPTDDVLCGYPGFNQISPLINPLTKQGWTVVDFLISQLQSKQLPKQIKAASTDLDESLFWPQAEFVQPLQGLE